MNDIIQNCPKAWEKYKEFLLDKYKEQNEKFKAFLTDEVLLINIKSAPMSATHFFDSLGQIGTYDYNWEDKVFDIKVGGEFIDVHEDHQYSDDRASAEKTLIKYLFSELEKTL